MQKSSQFAKSQQTFQKVINICNILLHAFKTICFGASEIDTPIEDPKLDGRDVERIRGSERVSSIGVLKKAGTHPEQHPMEP